MHWQDLALTTATIFFIIALIPTILSRDQKPALATSVLNATISAIIAAVYLSLHLWFATATTAVNSALWLLISVQTIAARRRREAGPVG
ncbi:MAG: hypothetical protein M3Z66_10675 [Chloroflexota bacterium]|nr:hypothetical protein [Chloroflexota bacterium]